jgi:flagellar FliL protein
VSKTEAPAEGQEKPKKSMAGKLILPLFALLNMAVVGGGGYLAYMGTLGFQYPTAREPAAVKELKKERSAENGASARVQYTMPVFTVNLAGTPRRLIRVEMTFEMLDKEGFEEIVRNSPRARDEIVRILNGKTFDDVETIQGKLMLKDQIAVTLNQSLKAGVVKDIYFNDFIIQ